MSISKETIDKIRESADVVEVVGDYVSLKKKGQSYMACCPFHNEKTPSFSVSPGKGIYKCFGCGKSGDAIQFVMDMEAVGYIDSLRHLARKYGIEVEERESTPEELLAQNEKESLYIVLNHAKNYYHDLLLNNEEGQAIGLSYFMERGFTDATIRKFELGYSLSAWDAFTKDAMVKNYKPELLEKAGLSLTRENQDGSIGRYDRFRGRVIFPIHNVTGRVIAFGARILKNEKNQPKYVNSPETEVYHKSKILYGIYQARQSIRQEENCFLVEGYTDVISLHQAGIENVVASSGTSLTEDQIRLIGRYTENITVLYDGDPAGIKASIRGIDLILEAGLNVNVVLFPDGDDPDSYVKKTGPAAFRSFINSAKQDFISFKTSLFLQEAGGDPIKKAGVIKEIIASIARIPDTIKRQVFIKQCSQLLEIDEQVLISENNKLRLALDKQKATAARDENIPEQLPEVSEEEKDNIAQVDVVRLHEREIIRLLINYGDDVLEEHIKVKEYLLSEVEDRDFKTDIYKKMLELIKKEGAHLSLSSLIAHDDSEIRNEAIDLISSKYELSKNWEKFQIFVTTEKSNLSSAIFTTITRLKWKDIEEMIEENKLNLKHPGDADEEEIFLKIHMKLKEAEKEIAKILGNVVR
jgi:DNA primase